MSFDAQMDADLAAVTTEIDADAEFTWSGGDYAAIISDSVKTHNLELSGYIAEYDLSIIVRTALFSGSTPAVSDKVTVGSIDYRIAEVRTSSDGLSLYLACKEDVG